MTTLSITTISDLSELHLLRLDDSPSGTLDISDRQHLAESAELVVNQLAVIEGAATLRITEKGRKQAIVAHNKRMVATVVGAVDQLMTRYANNITRKLDVTDLYKELRFELRPRDH